MGYEGIPKSIAIEIDTWRNEYDPHPLSDHISLNTQGLNANSANDNQSLVKAVTKPLGNVSDGQIHKLVIKSIPAKNGESEIVAYLDEITAPVLSAKLNLSNLLGKDADGKAFIGFTGSTGGAWQIAKIHNFKFNSGISLDNSPVKLAGIWNSPEWGAMTLVQAAGGKITGTYDHDGGQLTGILTGNRIEFRWWEKVEKGQPYESAAKRERGEGYFVLSEDGKSISGEWRYDGDTTWNSKWTAIKK